jgi:hypothetical protein
MSTRSTISIETPEGIRSIYCHFDGFLDHNGKILKEHYDTAEKVNALIDLGDISSLGEDLKKTVAYHRDRKEPLHIDKVNTTSDIDTQDYNYLFRDGKWIYWNDYCKLKEL